ncbi:uncharacterized protein VDAG_05124 [Verticillium dahliae VdLs.17]|uniref:DUF5672 domain-containing protein n=1 Tax=Verticillium dahliae (strain VdLs.17 / ATCC MYA-4575 / FGSC 10137) TaxID=498257 RepID=G2X4P2_VERDV|nr:uncharacterized protein VDAG_05124 [Verticillium dahliae VdLs.17]EGY23686.1 hypothetical protein VDAG_05124 [Verticillium dahliae VdLs.17]
MSNGGKLLIQLVDATDAEITDVAGRLAKVGVDAEFVLCDDDTFFLVAKLTTYDPTQPQYVGTLPEDMTTVRLHGSQAFGGGGVFLSRPLAKIIAGDILLRNCIYDNNDVRMTWMRDLWQLDLSGGDASGFCESGIKPFSIHHFKAGWKWHTTYLLNTTQIAYTCGEDCPYQRIAQYPDGIDFRLDQVERTFRSRPLETMPPTGYFCD